MTTVVQIAENILLLSFMGLAYFLIESNRRHFGTTAANVLKGVCFGLAAALVTAVPVTLGDGATIDARAGPVIIAGIAAGPIGAAIAALMGAVSRGLVGGNFALSGVVVYAVYAVAGLLLARSRIAVIDSLTRIRTVVLIVLASFAAAASIFSSYGHSIARSAGWSTICRSCSPPMQCRSSSLRRLSVSPSSMSGSPPK